MVVVDDEVPLLPLSTPPPATPPPCILPVWDPGSPTGLALECRVQAEGSTVSGPSTWYKVCVCVCACQDFKLGT